MFGQVQWSLSLSLSGGDGLAFQMDMCELFVGNVGHEIYNCVHYFLRPRGNGYISTTWNKVGENVLTKLRNTSLVKQVKQKPPRTDRTFHNFVASKSVARRS